MSMQQREKELQQLKDMMPGQWRYVNWHEEGGGEVQRVHDVYVLFEIPIYGGEPDYVATYNKHALEELVTEAYSRN